MAEKFRKIVATPEEAAKKLRQKIAEKNPVEYIRARRTAKNAANPRWTISSLNLLRSAP